jgi:hypothetical protein
VATSPPSRADGAVMSTCTPWARAAARISSGVLLALRHRPGAEPRRRRAGGIAGRVPCALRRVAEPGCRCPVLRCNCRVPRSAEGGECELGFAIGACITVKPRRRARPSAAAARRDFPMPASPMTTMKRPSLRAASRRASSRRDSSSSRPITTGQMAAWLIRSFSVPEPR